MGIIFISTQIKSKNTFSFYFIFFLVKTMLVCKYRTNLFACKTCNIKHFVSMEK